MHDNTPPARSTPYNESHGDRAHLEYVLRNSGTSATLHLAELSNCQGRIILLISARISRAWTSEEHAKYLDLRRHQQGLQRDYRRALRTFDHARTRLQGIDSFH